MADGDAEFHAILEAERRRTGAPLSLSPATHELYREAIKSNEALCAWMADVLTELQVLTGAVNEVARAVDEITLRMGRDRVV